MESQWKDIVSALSEEIQKAYILTYFRKTAIVSSEDGVLTIGLPSEFFLPWMEKNAKKAICKAAKLHFPDCQEVEFEVDGNLEETSTFDPNSIFGSEKKKVKKASSAGSKGEEKVSRQIGFSERFLHPDYSFETFINGPNTALAEAAAKTVAREPGRKYNPLFLFGGVGLGKTHLLHAIGHEIAKHFASPTIVLLPAQTFVDEIVSAVRKGKGDKVRDRFRQSDVFMLDDVQFLKGKERTQEILFHLFNDLHSRGKQIVFSSDCPPNALEGLEARLVSRFSMGMIADVQMPDFETRLAILEEKADKEIDKNLLDLVAEYTKSSVRDLLAVLQQIIAHTELQGTPPNKTTLMQILKKNSREFREHLDELDTQKTGRARTIEEVMERTALFFDIPIEKLTSSTRLREYTLPRQVAMWFAHKRLKEPLQKIGNVFGGRDHTSVLSAVRKVDRLRKTDITFWRNVNTLRKELGW